MYAKKMMFVMLVVLSAISLFMFTSAAVAGPGHLEGTYVGTGGGTMILALCGFTSDGFPDIDGTLGTGLFIILQLTTEGRWTFDHKGKDKDTGSFQMLNYVLPSPRRKPHPQHR